MNKKVFILILVLFLSGDCIYSFLQHYHMKLDGDIAESVVPAGWVHKLFHDPIGLNVFLHGENYPNPNRFFSHGSMHLYLRHVPVCLQYFFNPVESVYLSCALFKSIIQAGIIILISLLVLQPDKKTGFDSFIITAAIIAPFFQTEGYNRFMGIIDKSITYTFFYAFPIMLLLLFYFLIYFYELRQRKIKYFIRMFLIILALILPFSGPLVPAVALISALLILLKKRILTDQLSGQPIQRKLIKGFRNISGFGDLLLCLLVLVSIYSLYIGSYNSSNSANELSLAERFSRMPAGIFNILTSKIGWVLILTMLGFNIYVINNSKYFSNKEATLSLFKWIGIFMISYLLLLPLGGYRIYRYNIIRYDTLLPVTLCILFLYAASTMFILKYIPEKYNLYYITALIIMASLFTLADSSKFNDNDCEKDAMNQIAASDEVKVFIENDCTIIAWEKINKPEESAMNAQLLEIWNITSHKRLYYQN